MPSDLQPILSANNVSGCIAIQADQSLEETAFLLDLAADYPFIYGVVGWIDLQSKELESYLEQYSSKNRLKGFRHIVQAETDPEFLIRSSFLSGINKLKKNGYTYDLLITHDQLPQAVAFAKLINDQPVVIDHLAKPDIINKKFKVWAAEIEKLSKFENFYCKISGLVTEADWKNWKIEDFEPYIEHVLNCFGTERIMFGSDWPVCNVAANYEQTVTILDTYVKKLSLNEQRNIWYQNAANFYHIKQ